MKPVRIAINGFGRIGRVTLRRILLRPDMELVAINDLAECANLAHLLKYDSVHGNFDGTVSCTGDKMIVNGHKISVFNEPDPAKLPWKELQIDVVIESTGLFIEPDKALLHVKKAGARKVIISAPAKDEREGVPYIVLGVMIT